MRPLRRLGHRASHSKAQAEPVVQVGADVHFESQEQSWVTKRHS